MIDRIELANLPDHGMAFTFYYDTDCMDTFSIHQPDHVYELMKLVARQPEPEYILVAIRDYGKFTLH